jgi:hypothetical protein
MFRARQSSDCEAALQAEEEEESALKDSRLYLEAQRRELEARLAIDFLSNVERVKLERALVGVIAKLETVKP